MTRTLTLAGSRVYRASQYDSVTRSRAYRASQYGLYSECGDERVSGISVARLLDMCRDHLESICLGDTRMEIVMEAERRAKRTVCRGKDSERLVMYILGEDDMMPDINHVRPSAAWREIEDFVWSMALQPPKEKT